MLVSFDSSCKELIRGIIMLNFIVSTYLLALEVGKFPSESVPGAWRKFLELLL